MASVSLSPLSSSLEKTNGAKLSRLLVDGGTTVLRKIFDQHHPRAILTADLNSNYSILNNLLRRRVLNSSQWDQLFPPDGTEPASNTFDITLLFVLLINICGLIPPPSGWHTNPPPSDTSHEANLARVKFYRNTLYGHVTTTGVDSLTFSTLWKEISAVLIDLGLERADIERLEAEKGGEQDYLSALHEWADSEEDIKSQLKNIAQSQAKSEQAINNITVGLEEVKQVVDGLKEQRDKEKAATVLQKLSKSEFKGDIDYHLQRFHVGTREWIFDRVQNWLDDRSSQNRVMVISGNAGMGKSVIAAVICKRMHEAGRLTGSHFCQYNNARYCKPQLMLQSLACHMSHVLPDYRQSLVEQLSRNLGMDVNNMSVEELFALLYKEPLNTVVDPGRNVPMVLDGLDESEYQGRNELLDAIVKQFSKLPTWIRFLVTTRPATNITEKLKMLNPFELQSSDERNLQDIRTFLKQNLPCGIKEENMDELLERLVLKSEGLMLYAYFLILFINENASALHQEPLDGSLPLGISSVYHSYFRRLQNELITELDIQEEHFLNLLSAITASREPLPVGFVSKVLVPGTNSTLAKRKVLKALGSVSALLPIRDERLHLIHKSVKDWLTDTSCYGEHEFIMDENEGHRILASLCTDELDNLKRKGVHNLQLSTTENYALYHGARHMIHPGMERRPSELEEVTKAYVIDLEVVYAKTCLNNTLAAEDLVWLQKEGFSALLSQDSQNILNMLLFLLRKYLYRFTDRPRVFLQTMLNQGGKVLSVEASILLQDKYPEIPYLENVHKEKQQGGVVARFECSSYVVCLDVSPHLEYMVCECSDGMLQLWSLHTGRLIWTRPVKVTKSFGKDYYHEAGRMVPSSDVFLFFRSVVFHPTEELVLPGVLSHAYTMDGILSVLFPKSSCSFSVCSVSRNKTKILTDCVENSKCLVLWSLESGSEIARITSNEDILSFAWSQDKGLLAISHPSGLIRLLDEVGGFRNLAQTSTPEVCGMLKFSPDNRFLFCLHWSGYLHLFRIEISAEKHSSFSLSVSPDEVSSHYKKFESFNDCGFVFGDLIRSELSTSITFVLNEQFLLRCVRREIEMVNTNEAVISDQRKASGIALSLDGQTVYFVSDPAVVTACNVLSGTLKAMKNFGDAWPTRLCPVKEGLLITTTSGTVELWNHDLSECVKKWANLSTITDVIPVSKDQVACVEPFEVKVLDTSSGEFVLSIPVLHATVLACNGKCQLLTISSSGSLQLLDGTTVVWEKDNFTRPFLVKGSLFSPTGQFLVIWKRGCLWVLDAVLGNTLRASDTIGVRDCKFVSDEECVVIVDPGDSVQLLSVKSGEVLSKLDVEVGRVTCLATCPHLFALGLENSALNFKVIRVHLPDDKDSRKSNRLTAIEKCFF